MSPTFTPLLGSLLRSLAASLDCLAALADVSESDLETAKYNNNYHPGAGIETDGNVRSNYG